MQWLSADTKGPLLVPSLSVFQWSRYLRSLKPLELSERSVQKIIGHYGASQRLVHPILRILMRRPLITSLYWIFPEKAGKADLCAKQFSHRVNHKELEHKVWPHLQRKLNFPASRSLPLNASE